MHSIVLCHSQLYCIVLLIYCYVDIIQYNAVHKFVRVLDNNQQREQERAVKSMLMNQDVLCCVADCILEELKITNVHLCDGKHGTKQHKNACPFTTIIKDQTTKARSLGIKCVFLLDIKLL